MPLRQTGHMNIHSSTTTEEIERTEKRKLEYLVPEKYRVLFMFLFFLFLLIAYIVFNTRANVVIRNTPSKP